MTLQSACSSSLTALKVAMQALQLDEIDIAIVAASCVRTPQEVGYDHALDPVLSKDGHCRPFDAQATGTLFGSGAAAIVLRKLKSVENASDNIHAVIRSCALNNDGGKKVSYTASSVPGQTAAMLQCIASADIQPESIGYIEAHGTATKIGDPLEIKALASLFKHSNLPAALCGVGSVKSNIGHLEQAAGLISIIKVALMLKNQKKVPTVNFSTVNPKLPLNSSPLYIVDRLETWHTHNGQPRVAAVNCLGMGGTNGFAVLEEAPYRNTPTQEDTHAGDEKRLVVLSAKSPQALHDYQLKLRTFIEENPAVDFHALCYSLTTGRSLYPYRTAFLVHDIDGLLTALHVHSQTSISRQVSWSESTYYCQVNQPLPKFVGLKRLREYWPVQIAQFYRQQIRIAQQQWLPHSAIASLPHNERYHAWRWVRRVVAESAYLRALKVLGIEFSKIETGFLGQHILGLVEAPEATQNYRTLIDALCQTPPVDNVGDHAGASSTPYLHFPFEGKVQECVETALHHVLLLLQRGANLNLSLFYPGKAASRISAPTYAYQRQRYWI